MENDLETWKMIARKFSGDMDQQEWTTLQKILENQPDLKLKVEMICLFRHVPAVSDNHNIEKAYEKLLQKIKEKKTNPPLK